VRVIGTTGQQLGILSLAEAITMARNNSVDLVEVAPNATPPVCRLVDYGKYRYEQSKREKEASACQQGQGGAVDRQHRPARFPDQGQSRDRLPLR
jgi:translation initiation factor IF-3